MGCNFVNRHIERETEKKGGGGGVESTESEREEENKRERWGDKNLKKFCSHVHPLILKN